MFGSVPMTVFSTITLVVASFTMAELSYEQQTQDLRARATVDGLTGLLNRSAFLDLAENELRRLRRTGTTASIILADLDHFKAINDQFGHSAGDSALQAFARACSGTVRSTDLVGRYGGEEFILLLPGVTPDRAREIAADISVRLHQSGVRSHSPAAHRELRHRVHRRRSGQPRRRSDLGRRGPLPGKDAWQGPRRVGHRRLNYEITPSTSAFASAWTCLRCSAPLKDSA